MFFFIHLNNRSMHHCCRTTSTILWEALSCRCFMSDTDIRNVKQSKEYVNIIISHLFCALISIIFEIFIFLFFLFSHSYSPTSTISEQITRHAYKNKPYLMICTHTSSQRCGPQSPQSSISPRLKPTVENEIARIID